MKIIEGYEKDMILQAVNKWASELNKDVRELADLEDKGALLPRRLVGLIRENANEVNKFYEKLEKLCNKNVVALEDSELDELIDSRPIGD